MKYKACAFLTIIIASLANGLMIDTIFAETTEEYVILFDESHGQYLNRTLMSSALDLINEDISEEDIKITKLFQNDTEFNEMNLQGVDLLIIGNPGSESENSLSPSEIEAIQDYVELGGALLLLSNPLANDLNVTGNPSTFNDLLGARINRLTSARFREGPDNSATIIVDDFNNVYDNETFVSIVNYNTTSSIFDYEEGEENNIVAETIFNQEYQVANLTLYSNAIVLGDENDRVGIGRVEMPTYWMNKEGDTSVDVTRGFLTWLYAKQTTNSRMILAGSEIMFSDLEIQEGEKWIEQEQNADLWLNSITYLLGLTPHEVDAKISIPFYTLVLLAIGFAIASFILSFILWRYRQARKTSIKIKQ